MTFKKRVYFIIYISFLLLLISVNPLYSQEHTDNSEDGPVVCGGFIEFDSSITPEMKKLVDFSNIHVEAYSSDMILKETTNLAASGYYFLPLYENEPFILKIKGPHGMNFEPEQYIFSLNNGNTIQEICQKDFNFKFRGFNVEGQISTFGTNEGPEGISLALFNSITGEKIQTTKSAERGLFKFKPVNPGNYILRPNEDLQMFDLQHSELKFEVKINKSNFLEKALIIRGFKVSGKVMSDNEPMQNVLALIYTTNLTLIKDYVCDNPEIKNVQKDLHNGLSPFCLVLSDPKGNFVFNNIPFGQFIIKPIVKNQFVTYNFEPNNQIIDVKHKDYSINIPFKVDKFSIYGSVVNSKKIGIANVTIKVDGQVISKTDSQGVYKLENINSGVYDVEAYTEDMFFEPLTNIKIYPGLNKLPELTVTDYKLCGNILIEAKDYYNQAKRTVVLQEILNKEKATGDNKGNKKEQRTITDNKGKYCFEVKPGFYHVYPILTQDEKDSDLHLQPDFHDIEIDDKPRLDVDFYQSKVSLSGTIKVLNETDNNIKVHLVSLKTDKIVK